MRLLVLTILIVLVLCSVLSAQQVTIYQPQTVWQPITVLQPRVVYTPQTYHVQHQTVFRQSWLFPRWYRMRHRVIYTQIPTPIITPQTQ